MDSTGKQTLKNQTRYALVFITPFVGPALVTKQPRNVFERARLIFILLSRRNHACADVFIRIIIIPTYVRVRGGWYVNIYRYVVRVYRKRARARACVAVNPFVFGRYVYRSCLVVCVFFNRTSDSRVLVSVFDGSQKRVRRHGNTRPACSFTRADPSITGPG